jgi:RNA polymerase sigma-70 factor (ECF subfamily)
MIPDGADTFLVEQIRQGSESAWRQLIARYEGRLLAFARAQTPTIADAEDLVQETFVGFLQSLARYDSARSLETYLFTILRYKLIDLFRRRKVPLVTSPGDDPEDDVLDRVAPVGAETPSGHAVRSEARQARRHVLRDALRAFISECRDRGAFDDLQVIELLFFAGKRNLEAAELLDLDQKAVAGIKFRTIQRLRSFVEQSADADRCELDEQRAEVTVARVWREFRLTCLKRSTLGSYVLGILDEPWCSYTQFHLDVVGCPMCLANLQDLQEEQTQSARPLTASIFTSSVGFLSRVSGEGSRGGGP